MTADGRDLARTAPAAVVVGRTVALDWYDGPRVGFVELGPPTSVWHFRAFAEARPGAEDDDLLYLLAPVPADTMTRLLAALAPLGPPSGAFWVPPWSFPTEAERLAVEAAVDELEAAAGPVELVVRSADLRSVRGIWLTL